MKSTSIDLTHLIDNFVMNGGEITQLKEGNALKHDDGENWQQVNRKTYLIKLDKEMGK